MSGGLLLKSQVVDDELYYVQPKNGIITIPSGVKTVNEHVVIEKCDVDKIVIPNTVVEIKDHAFANCKSIRSIKFGKNIKTIGSEAFPGIEEQYINLPASVKEIASDAFNKKCVIGIDDEMPFYNDETKNIEGKRNKIVEKENEIYIISEKVSNIQQSLQAHKDSKAIQFEMRPEYEKQLNDIEERRLIALNDIESRQQELSESIKQIELDIKSISEERKGCFFLAISKKKNLDERLRNKQNELAALYAHQKELDEEKNKTKKLFMDELSPIKDKLYKLKLSEIRWNDKEASIEKEISSTNERLEIKTKELNLLRDELKSSEGELKSKHTKWLRSKTRAINKHENQLLKYEKQDILSKLKIPTYTSIPVYEYKPENSIIEERLLNQLYINAIVEWNAESEANAMKSYIDSHQKEIKRVKIINSKLNLEKFDGIQEYAFEEYVSPKGTILPERFVYLNEHFSKYNEWKRLVHEFDEKKSCQGPFKKLIGKTPYIRVVSENQEMYIFPYLAVKLKENKPLKVWVYDNIKAVAEYTEEDLEVQTIPPHGELINEHYMYLNVNGTPNRRYKTNPLVKTIRYTVIKIVAGGISFSVPFDNYDKALRIEKCLNEYFDLFNSESIKIVYSKILESAELETIKGEIIAIEKKEKEQIILQKQKVLEEKQRLEEEKKEKQIALEEKKRSIIERQKKINQERKKQQEQEDAKRIKLETMFADDFQTSSDKKAITENECSESAGIKICGNRLISNTVFKVQIEIIKKIDNKDIVAFFVSDTQKIISNKKILSSQKLNENSLTVGFVLNSGVDYSSMEKCFLCFELEEERICSVDFKMNISFYSDF